MMLSCGNIWPHVQTLTTRTRAMMCTNARRSIPPVIHSHPAHAHCHVSCAGHVRTCNPSQEDQQVFVFNHANSARSACK
jgi:hypothetical protein